LLGDRVWSAAGGGDRRSGGDLEDVLQVVAANKLELQERGA
jgi:hypothetical protein